MAEETTVEKVKPGWKTTELYFYLAAAIFGVFLAQGTFTEAGGCVDQWCTVVNTAVGGVVTLLAALGYGKSRTVAKATAAGK